LSISSLVSKIALEEEEEEEKEVVESAGAEVEVISMTRNGKSSLHFERTFATGEREREKVREREKMDVFFLGSRKLLP
jgi:hypothetical protein